MAWLTETQVATIIASAPGFSGASQSVSILDADVPRLILSLATNSVFEADSVVATLRRDFVTADALTVQIQSSDPNRINPPLSVTIPGGTNSVSFRFPSWMTI